MSSTFSQRFFYTTALTLLLFFLVFVSCNEEQKPQPVMRSNQKEMTDVEIFANSLNFVVVKSDEKFIFTVPYGFDLQHLSKTIVLFKLSEGANSDSMSGSELDFTSVESINITVTAADKTTKVYTIEKNVELNSNVDLCITNPSPGCPNWVQPEFFPGENKPPTFIACFRGAYYRKAVSSRDNKWRGIVTKVVLPEIHFDLDRPHPTRPQQYLDNFSVYLGGNASGQETDIGLTWEVIRLPNGSVTADRRAFRPFWRTTKFDDHEITWANADALNTNYHYYPGDTLIMSLVFVSERMVKFEVIGQGSIAHKKFSTEIECRGFTSSALTEYKRVNAIDQVNNEGRPVQPTKAKAVGLEWLETNFLRLEGTDIVTVPMHSGRFTDMRCPEVTHIEITASDDDKKIGAEKVNIYGTP